MCALPPGFSCRIDRSDVLDQHRQRGPVHGVLARKRVRWVGGFSVSFDVRFVSEEEMRRIQVRTRCIALFGDRVPKLGDGGVVSPSASEGKMQTAMSHKSER
jgi:hypothetical protein